MLGTRVGGWYDQVGGCAAGHAGGVNSYAESGAHTLEPARHVPRGAFRIPSVTKLSCRLTEEMVAPSLEVSDTCIYIRLYMCVSGVLRGIGLIRNEPFAGF